MHIAGRYEACSTLIIGGFIEYYTDKYIRDNVERYPQHYSREALLKRHIVCLKQKIKMANSPDYKEKIFDIYNPTVQKERHKLDGHTVDKFAFFWTTVFVFGEGGSPYGTVHSVLREIGFTIDDSETFTNKKNRTKVWPCYGSVPKILAFLDKYDHKGDLLPVEEVKTPAEKEKEAA